MTTHMPLTSLFEKEPSTWGLRGDPFLWSEMRVHFDKTPLPASTRELARLIEEAFATLTGHSIHETDSFFIERFSHGGMSSGHISPKFWRDNVIPLLCERFNVSNSRTTNPFSA